MLGVVPSLVKVRPPAMRVCVARCAHASKAAQPSAPLAVCACRPGGQAAACAAWIGVASAATGGLHACTCLQASPPAHQAPATPAAANCRSAPHTPCSRRSSAGEASAPDDVLWLMARAGYKPVMDSIGGTEIGGSFLTGSPLQPQCLGTFSTPAVGHCPAILQREGSGGVALSLHGDCRRECAEFGCTCSACHVLHSD